MRVLLGLALFLTFCSAQIPISPNVPLVLNSSLSSYSLTWTLSSIPFVTTYLIVAPIGTAPALTTLAQIGSTQLMVLGGASATSALGIGPDDLAITPSPSSVSFTISGGNVFAARVTLQPSSFGPVDGSSIPTDGSVSSSYTETIPGGGQTTSTIRIAFSTVVAHQALVATLLSGYVAGSLMSIEMVNPAALSFDDTVQILAATTGPISVRTCVTNISCEITASTYYVKVMRAPTDPNPASFSLDFQTVSAVAALSFGFSSFAVLTCFHLLFAKL